MTEDQAWQARAALYTAVEQYFSQELGRAATELATAQARLDELQEQWNSWRDGGELSAELRRQLTPEDHQGSDATTGTTGTTGEASNHPGTPGSGPSPDGSRTPPSSSPAR